MSKINWKFCRNIRVVVVIIEEQRNEFNVLWLNWRDYYEYKARGLDFT